MINNICYINRVWNTPRLAIIANKLYEDIYNETANLDNLQERLDVLDAIKDKLVFMRTKDLKEVESLRG